MDYGKLIDKQVIKAFKRAGSLTTTAVLHLKSGEGFNFATARKTVTSESDKTVKALVVQTEMKKEVVHKKLLIERVEALDAFDTVSLEGQEWKMGAVILNNREVQMFEIYRG